MSSVSTTPTHLDLQRYVTPQYAAKWRKIGAELGLADAKLDIISANNPRSVEECCRVMFSEWLKEGITPSWEKLFTAIESPPAVSGRGT